jgi:DNA repair protein RAD5
MSHLWSRTSQGNFQLMLRCRIQLILQVTELIEVMRREKDQELESSPTGPDIVLRLNNFQSSTKLDALVHDLSAYHITLLFPFTQPVTEGIVSKDPCFKAVVFSQFTSFIDLIEIALKREGFEYFRFDGTMDLKKRTNAIAAFKAPSAKPRILVISLKAGGVGLNVSSTYYRIKMLTGYH